MNEADRNGSGADLQALDYAHRSLGPSSYEVLSSSRGREELRREVQAGRSSQEAALAVLYRYVRDNEGVALEFFQLILDDLVTYARGLVGAEVRRHVDGEDLMQSILADIWPDLHRIEFGSKSAFRALIRRRLEWKVAEKLRRGRSKKRRDDLRQSNLLGGLEANAIDPHARTDRRDDLDALTLQILRLPCRERDVLTRHLEGQSSEEIGTALGVSQGAVNRTLSRARQKLRRFE